MQALFDSNNMHCWTVNFHTQKALKNAVSNLNCCHPANQRQVRYIKNAPNNNYFNNANDLLSIQQLLSATACLRLASITHPAPQFAMNSMGHKYCNTEFQIMNCLVLTA